MCNFVAKFYNSIYNFTQTSTFLFTQHWILKQPHSTTHTLSWHNWPVTSWCDTCKKWIMHILSFNLYSLIAFCFIQQLGSLQQNEDQDSLKLHKCKVQICVSAQPQPFYCLIKIGLNYKLTKWLTQFLWKSNFWTLLASSSQSVRILKQLKSLR